MQAIIKPRTLGLLTKPERRRGSVSFIVTALGLFDLAAPADLMAEQALWPMVAKELPQGQVLDLGMPKPRTEVLVAGSAVAPDGQSVRSLGVAFEVGPVAKRLAVFGNRFWQQTPYGPVFTAPEPFTELRLVPERAFGGPGHPTNPGGLGFPAQQLLASGQPVPLPNIEIARNLITSVTDAPMPALIGPMDPGHPARLRYAGTYDQTWLDKDAPGLPADVDPRLFLVAPEDQMVQGYLRGDEPYRLAGFSSAQPELAGQLPGFAVRCFIRRISEPAGIFELATRLDTVWLFASQGKGVLIWRGAATTADVEGRDVTAILLAYERLGDPPRPVEHYAEQIALRTNPDPLEAVKHSFADGALRPPIAPAEHGRRHQARLAYNAQLNRRHDDAKRYFLTRQSQKLGLPPALVPAVPPSEPPPFLLPTPEDVARGEVDLAALIDGVERFAREKLDELRVRAETLARPFNEAGAAPLTVAQLDALIDRVAAGATPDGGVSGALSRVRESLALPEAGDPASAEAAERGRTAIDALLGGVLAVPTGDEEAQLSEARSRFIGGPEASPVQGLREAIDAARAQIALQPAAASAPVASDRPPLNIDALLAGSAPSSEAPAGARASAEQAGSRMAAAEDQLAAAFPALASHANVRPLDALIASLSTHGPAPSAAPAEQLAAAQTEVEKAADEAARGLRAVRAASPTPLYPPQKLAPAVARRLGALVQEHVRSGGVLAGKDLAGADLSGIDLSGMDLRGAFLERTNLTGARLRGADCTGAVFAGAELSDADLSACDLTTANLGEALLRRTSFAGAKLKGTMLLGAVSPGASFANATLEDLQIMKGELTGANLDGASLRNVIVLSTSMVGATARGARLERCQFLDCEARAADFSQAELERCAFLQIKLQGCCFVRARLDTVSFAGNCDLSAADFQGVHGKSVGFTAAMLDKATFGDARLDDASFMDSVVCSADFRFATLRTAMLNSANLIGADFFGANLIKSQLRRANLSGASLRSANLFSCDLTDTSLVAADLTGANLRHTRLEAPSRVG
jgi:uncharacterized protein YjbI with pentapeptide repeats